MVSANIKKTDLTDLQEIGQMKGFLFMALIL